MRVIQVTTWCWDCGAPVTINIEEPVAQCAICGGFYPSSEKCPTCKPATQVEVLPGMESAGVAQ